MVTRDFLAQRGYSFHYDTMEGRENWCQAVILEKNRHIYVEFYEEVPYLMTFFNGSFPMICSSVQARLILLEQFLIFEDFTLRDKELSNDLQTQ
jgi:hypothetical protein